MGGGGTRRFHSSRSRSLFRPLRALYAFVMVSCGGSEEASGRRSAFGMAAKDRVTSIGRARMARCRRVGRSSGIARRCARWGERPKPGGESLLKVAKAPWPSPILLEKCADDARLGVNQYASH